MKPVPPLLLLAEGRKPRSRNTPKSAPREIELHMAIAGLLRRHMLPGWAWGHYPAGELRDPRTAAKLKAMGVKRGWPDFILLAPSGGRLHAMEAKRVGETLTEDQEDFQRWAIRQGVPYSVVYSMSEALPVLQAWGCLTSIGGAP